MAVLMVTLPPEAALGGYFELPILTFTALSGRPNVSAATMPMAVRVPVPRS